MSPESNALTASSFDGFGPVHVLEPRSEHTHTAILLHGRGSNGEEFAEELCESKLSDQTALAQRFAGWRWVFPSSRQLWSTAFEEEIPAWFEAHSLTYITAREDSQIPGIRDSVSYVQAILTEEINRLGGKTERVVLGGISQGGAIGMWTLLVSKRRLGAFIGASTWLPFATKIEAFFSKVAHSGGRPTARSDRNEGKVFVEDMMTTTRASLIESQGRGPFLSTPVFLGHGIDDAYVGIELGKQARQVLSEIGLIVEWRDYSGAELEGH